MSEQRSIFHQAYTAVTCDPRSSRYLSSLSTNEHLTWRTVLSLSRRGLSASHPAPRLSPHSTLRTMLCGYSVRVLPYVCPCVLSMGFNCKQKEVLPSYTAVVQGATAFALCSLRVTCTTHAATGPGSPNACFLTTICSENGNLSASLENICH